jgi:hypothetical protein
LRCHPDQRGNVPAIEILSVNRQRRHRRPKKRTERHPHARSTTNAKSTS